ncbi:MAG: purine-binding chemotaxis protein CheW [Pseudomonadota bacterium]|nr:purine-binding chemotaxis protein CheW [Pseudomonadota bacterium]
MADHRQFCTFFLDDRFFGVEVEKVQEVIRYQIVTPVPLASPVICGLINLRGQIVTAIDLRRLLRLADRTDDRRPINIVVHTRQGTFSLLVDRIGDVLDVEQSSFEHPPDTLDGIARELIQGTYKLPDCLLLTLNIDKLFNPALLNRFHTVAKKTED